MRRSWTHDDDQTLRRNYADFPTFLVAHILNRQEAAVYNRAQKLGLHKSAAYLAGPWACRLRRGGNIGATTRFHSGHVPANKGLRRPGWAPGRMATTQFKKGQKPHGWMPIGSTRYSKEGYLQRKITDTGYPPRDWIAEHVLLWEEHLGRVPPGHAVCFRNGDRTDIRIDNLVLLHRSVLMRRNSIHTRYPKNVVSVMQLRGALTRQINRRIRKETTPCPTTSTTCATTSSGRSPRCATRTTPCRSTARKP